MKHLKLFFACLLMAVLSIGQVWGADQIYSGTVAKVDANGDQTMNGVAWTITSDNTSGLGQQVNSSKGAQIGSGSKPTKALTFETTGISGTIKQVVVNTSGASGFSGTVSVTVGSTAFLCNSASTASLTTSAADYTFTGEASGKITISWSQTTSKAIYVKTISVTYGEASSCTSEITITKADDPENGTFELDESGKVCIDEGNATVNVTATPNTGYHLATVTSTVGTVGDIDGNTCAITNIGANTTISVTFAANPKYKVSFNVGGSTASQADITEASAGAGIELPAGPTPTCSADGWVFAGWKETSAVSPQTTTAPTLLNAGDTYHPTDNVTLYAVYKKTETSGSGVAFARYEKVTSNPADWSGQYLLAANTAGTTYYTFSGKTGATAGGSTEHTPGTTEKTAWEVTVAQTTNGYSLYHNGEYLGLTSDGNNLNFNSTFTATNYEWTLSYDNGAQSVAYPARYIECNTSSSFKVACYKATQKRFYLYKRIEEEASTTYYLSTPTCADPTCEDLGTPAVTVTNKTYNSAKLTWEAVANADKYLVKFNGVDQDATDNTYFDATGLEAATVYTYQVKALAEEGQDDYCDGAFSAEANFTTEPAPAATLTLSENTVTHNLAGDHTLGETVTLPSADDCSKKFRGWSVNENCETEPELHAGDSYTLNATSQTLYAVYAKVMSVSDPSLTKLGSGATFADGDKLVIAAKGTKYAIYFENAGSSYVKNWEFAGDDPILTELTDSKKILTLVKSGDNWKFGDAINGYFYSSSSNNLEISTTNSSEFNSFVWNTTEEAFTITKTDNRYLNCRTDLTSTNANLWRFNGTNTNSGSPFLYVYKYSAGDATYGEWSTTCTAPLASPTFSVDPADGPFTSAQSVELSATEGTIYYNINSADDPTSASTPYTGAIDVDACGSTTIKAIAISSTNQSLVASATYVLNLPIPENAENNPYSIATAKSVIDGGCYNNEDVYVTGTVASAQLYNSGTYTVTLEDGFQFYYLYKAAGETPFDSGDETIEAGDVLVAFGKLGMHNTTYQLDHGYLVSRTPAPKTPIDSDIDNPISVAAAVNYIDNAATYDLSEDEFVAGIVESIAECPQHEGTYDIIVLDATDNTKQMKFFGCDVKTFTGIKQYDQITGKGKLDKYYSTYELNYPCEVVALTPYVAPIVDVTGVEVDETATVKVGKTVQLTANVIPANASNKNVTWSVKAGDESKASVSATGLVTGLAEGEAIIVVTTAEGNFTDECTVTVTAGINFAAGDFVLVEDAAELTEGTYVIVAGAGENNVAMKYHAGNSDGNHKGKAAVKEGKYLHYDADFGVYEIKDYVVEEVKQGISFYNENAENYFALPGNSNQLKTSTEQNNNSSWTAAVSEGVTTLTNKALTTRTLRYNINGGSPIFACYTSSQQPIALYKYVTPAAYRVYYNDNVAEEEIEVPAYQSVDGENKVTITTVEPVRDGYLFGGWKDGEANVYEAGVEYTLSGDITLYAQWTTATVSTLSYNPNGGTLISGETAIAPADVAEGTNLTIEANVYEKGDNFVFAGWQLGDDVYQPGDPFVMPATDVEFVAKWDAVEVSDYTLVTDVAQLQAWDKIIIVAANLDFAAGAQAGTYRESVAIGKTASKNNLVLAGYGAPTEFTLGISEGKYSFYDGTGYMYEEEAKKVKNQADPYYWTISIDGNAIATISATNALKYNSGSPRFTTYESGQQVLQLYRKPGAAPEPSYTEVRSGLTAGNYYTICYPKAMTDVQGATLWSFVGKDADFAYIVQETATTIEAGKPYILYATASTVTAVLGDETNAPGANGAIHGTFSDLTQDQLNTYATVAGHDLYLVIGDQLRKATGYALDGITPLTGNSLPANRAFVVLAEITPATANMPAHVRRMPMQKDVATGFENLNASEKPVKLMIDGNIFILRGEKLYDATGRLVK